MLDRLQLVIFYVDNSNKIHADNIGYGERLELTKGNNVDVPCIIPLNRYSFFKSLETNLLPPSQIQISLSLTDDNILIYRHDTMILIMKLVE